MIDVLSVSEMRERENRLFSSGVSEWELMELAVSAIAPYIDNTKKTLFVCGKGNNAGDALGVCYKLKTQNASVEVALIYDELKPCAVRYLETCRSVGVKVMRADECDFSRYEQIVDGIFGIGFHGDLPAEAENVIKRINQSGKFVISIDVPSGLNGDNGTCEYAVKADVTIAVGALKTGLILNRAKDFVGKKIVADIGIESNSAVKLAEECDFTEILAERENFVHKGKYGYVGIMGGSKNYSGAVKLANLSLSQLRAGAGVSRLIVPDCISHAVTPYLTVSTLFSLPDNGEHIIFDEERLKKSLENLCSLAFGMGMTDNVDTAEIIKYILKNYTLKLMIDADGLNALSPFVESLKNTRCKVVITPHVKEFSRLTGINTQRILSDPVNYARSFAREYGVIVLLKGTATVVTDGTETVLVDRGSPAMATAGSGDVLDGIISGIMGYNDISVRSVACGAFLNGLSGEFSERKNSAISAIATDTLTEIAEAVKFLCNNK